MTQERYFNAELFNLYEVGGCIRDEFLGIEPKDRDYVLEVKPDRTVAETIGWLESQGFEQVGKDFPVFLNPDNGDEWALARIERKVGKGYHGFETQIENVSIEDDLLRRDLTANSIARNLLTGEYVQPKGVAAIRDIEDKILRPTSEAFVEDPLRFVRLARMSAKMPDFSIAYGEFLPMLTDGIKEEMKSISQERVVKEIIKTLEAPRPSNFFKVLNELNLLEIFLPDIAKMVGKEQGLIHHAEGDVFEHTMRVLDRACELSEDPIVRFGALMHDVGKPYTYLRAQKEDEDMKNAYFGHQDGHLVMAILEGYVEGYKFPKKYVDFSYRASAMHHHMHLAEELSPHKLTEIFLNRQKDPTTEKYAEKMAGIESMMENFKIKIEMKDEKGGKRKRKKKQGTPPLITTREDLEGLVLVAMADAHGRIGQGNKANPQSLNEEEKELVFLNGRYRKGSSLFSSGKELSVTNYDFFLEAYDFLEENKDRCDYHKNVLVNCEEFQKTGKVDEADKERFVYRQTLNVMKAFHKKYHSQKKTCGPQIKK